MVRVLESWANPLRTNHWWMDQIESHRFKYRSSFNGIACKPDQWLQIWNRKLRPTEDMVSQTAQHQRNIHVCQDNDFSWKTRWCWKLWQGWLWGVDHPFDLQGCAAGHFLLVNRVGGWRIGASSDHFDSWVPLWQESVLMVSFMSINSPEGSKLLCRDH